MLTNVRTTKRRTPSAGDKRHAIMAASLAVCGIGLITGGTLAGAAIEASKSPHLQLTSVDADVITVSGRNFSADTDVIVKAKSPTATGVAKVRASNEGRILLGFQLPGGAGGHIAVTATSGSDSTTESIDVATAPGTGFGNEVLSDKLTSLSGAADFNARLATFAALKARLAANTTTLAALLASSDASKRSADINSAITTLADTTATLAQQESATATAIHALNARITSTTSNDELQAIAPDVAKASAGLNDQIRSVKLAILTQEILLESLRSSPTEPPATPTTSTSTSTSTTTSTTSPSDGDTPASPAAGNFDRVPIIDVTPK